MSARFKPKELRKLLRYDRSVLESLHDQIQSLDNPTRGLNFQKLVLKSQTIFELRQAYMTDFPMLDFEVFELCADHQILKRRT